MPRPYALLSPDISLLVTDGLWLACMVCSQCPCKRPTVDIYGYEEPHAPARHSTTVSETCRMQIFTFPVHKRSQFSSMICFHNNSDALLGPQSVQFCCVFPYRPTSSTNLCYKMTNCIMENNALHYNVLIAPMLPPVLY